MIKSWQRQRGNKPAAGNMRGRADGTRLKKAWAQFRQNKVGTPTHPNNRNAATGVKTATPVQQGLKSRVGAKPSGTGSP